MKTKAVAREFHTVDLRKHIGCCFSDRSIRCNGLHTIMMSSSNDADLHDDSLDLDDDKPSRAHASDEGDIQ